MSLRDFAPLLGLLGFAAVAGVIGARFRGAIGGSLLGGLTGILWVGYLTFRAVARLSSSGGMSIGVAGVGSSFAIGAIIGGLTGGFTAWAIRTRNRRKQRE